MREGEEEARAKIEARSRWEAIPTTNSGGSTSSRVVGPSSWVEGVMDHLMVDITVNEMVE